MSVSIESTGNLGRRVTIAVPAQRFEQEFSTRLKRLSKNVRVPGFRPGKVPMRMVEAQYGGQVMEEVMSELIRSSFYETVGKEGLRPAGGPRIEPKTVERGKDLEYTAEFEIYPEVNVGSIEGREIDRAVVTVTDSDVDQTLDTMRRQRLTWNAVDRAAKEGDRVRIDFKGMRDGQPFEGGEAKDFPIVLGSKNLIPGFEDGLVGAQAGDERTLDLKFPDDYRNTPLAGQMVQFQVKVIDVAEAVLPDLNADFATQFGIGDGSVEALRAEVKANLEREAQERVRESLREQVFKALADATPFDVPASLVEQEAARLLRLNRSSLQAQGVPADRLPNDSGVYKDRAQQRVTLGLILAELVKTKGLKVESARVRARLEEMASGYESPEEFVRWHYAQPERLAEVESLVLEEQVLESLLGTVRFKDKPMSFQELVQRV
jgi:trigger factor